MVNVSHDLVSAKAITLSLIAAFSTLLLLLYQFETYRPFAASFFGIHYPIGPPAVATHYGCGLFDLCTLGFYTGLALIIMSGVEELLLKLSICQDDEGCAKSLGISLCYIVSVILGIVVLAKQDFGFLALFGGLPSRDVPYLLKVYYVIQFTFLLQTFLLARLQQMTVDKVIRNLCDKMILIFVLFTSYAFSHAPTGALVLTTHFTALLLGWSSELTSNASVSKGIRCSIFGIELLLNVVLIGCMTWYGGLRSFVLGCLYLFSLLILASLALGKGIGAAGLASIEVDDDGGQPPAAPVKAKRARSASNTGPSRSSPRLQKNR